MIAFRTLKFFELKLLNKKNKMHLIDAYFSVNVKHIQVAYYLIYVSLYLLKQHQPDRSSIVLAEISSL